MSLLRLKICKGSAAKFFSAALPRRSLVQRIEQVRSCFEFRFANTDNSWVCALERFFNRNSIDPALVREFFVIGKIEAHNQPNLPGICP